MEFILIVLVLAVIGIVMAHGSGGSRGPSRARPEKKKDGLP